MNIFRLPHSFFCFVLIVLLQMLSPAFAEPTTKPQAISLDRQNCEKLVADVDQKFKVKLDKDHDPVSLADADASRLCVANSGAALDKRIQGDDSPLSKACPDSSVCRSTYLSLREAIGDYKKKLRVACEKAKQLGKDCAVGQLSENPKEAFRCVAAKTREAAAAQKDAADTLANALELAEELRQEASKIEERYNKDLDQIREAYRNLDVKIEAARARGDQTQVQSLTELRKKATTIEDGELVQGSPLLDYGKAEAATTSLNGGQETIASYKALLGEPDPLTAKPQLKGASNVTGLLLREQEWAIQAATSFQNVAQKEVDDLRARSSNLSSFALKNEQIFKGNTGDATGSSSEQSIVPAVSLGSVDPNSLVQAGAAANSLSGLVQRGSGTNAFLSSGASSGLSLASPVGQHSGGLSGTAGNRPTNSNFRGDLASPSGPLTGIDSRQRGEKNTGALGPRTGGGDAVTGRPGSVETSREINQDNSSMGLGKVGVGAAASRSSTASGSIGDPAGLGSRKPAQESNGRATGCVAGEKTCSPATSMTAMNLPQYNAAGGLGVALVGAPNPDLATAGALDGLFGPISELDPSKLDVSQASTPNGIMNTGWESGLAAAEQGAVLASPDIAQSNTRSLFVRVHSVHEKALKGGAVSLFQRKLE